MTRRSADRYTPSLLDKAEMRTGVVARVAMILPIEKTYSYWVPDELAARLQPGMRVQVPFGRRGRSRVGFCMSVSSEPWQSTLKPLEAIVDDRPLLNDKLLELGEWIARYYACSVGKTLDMMVPSAAKRQAGWKRVRYAKLVPPPQAAPLAPPLSRGGGGGCSESAGVLSPEQSAQSNQASTDTTSESSVIDRPSSVPTPPPTPPWQGGSGPLRESRPLTARQTAALAVLREAGGRLPLDAWREQAGCGLGLIKALVAAGYIAIETEREPVAPAMATIPRHEPQYDLNEDQRRAVDQISAAVTDHTFSVQVLFGVTGSGKTECYVHAIRGALAEGRQAIMLVPEIALTTQTVQRLQARFERVAVLHSELGDAERSRIWAAVKAGEMPVVIGTRSAVFAPCPNVGIIIVDEEPESSYKNQSAPRYHARDVAVKRAHLEGIPVVLGSATPSLETWHNLQRYKHYHLIRLPHRVRGLSMPTVHLVNMREEHRARRGVHLLSRAMEWHLAEALKRGEQAVLLLNRRGYASFLHCPRCGTAVVCPHCSVHMVFHSTTELAHCHYCHARLAIPTHCQMAGCGGTLVRFGIGTQRVEQELREKFPTARVERVDSDVMEKQADYQRVFGAFERRECDVLVGTQMIAKGLDFPFVSFVGVVSADTVLALNDFRAAERTFQLVLQVAGRSGRGDVGGHVVVQTFSADTDAILLAVQGDYEAFAEQELASRRKNHLPPGTRMIRIVLSDPRLTKLEAAAAETATRLAAAFQRAGIAARIFDPAPSPLERLRDEYRYDILIVMETAAALLSATELLRSTELLPTNVHGVTVDVDPVSLQ